jgi:transcriptional regulator with XRE-family HTH domain
MSGPEASLVTHDSLEDQRRFGREIRALRVSRGKSEEDIAKHADLDRDRYSAIERGEETITYLTLLRIAAALEAPPSEIVRRADDL